MVPRWPARLLLVTSHMARPFLVTSRVLSIGLLLAPVHGTHRPAQVLCHQCLACLPASITRVLTGCTHSPNSAVFTHLSLCERYVSSLDDAHKLMHMNNNNVAVFAYIPGLASSRDPKRHAVLRRLVEMLRRLCNQSPHPYTMRSAALLKCVVLASSLCPPSFATAQSRASARNRGGTVCVFVNRSPSFSPWLHGMPWGADVLMC